MVVLLCVIVCYRFCETKDFCPYISGVNDRCSSTLMQRPGNQSLTGEFRHGDIAFAVGQLLDLLCRMERTDRKQFCQIGVTMHDYVLDRLVVENVILGHGPDDLLIRCEPLPGRGHGLHSRYSQCAHLISDIAEPLRVPCAIVEDHRVRLEIS